MNLHDADGESATARDKSRRRKRIRSESIRIAAFVQPWHRRICNLLLTLYLSSPLGT